jgi:hypothetical protein
LSPQTLEYASFHICTAPGPQIRLIGNEDASDSDTVVFRLSGHDSIGPSAVRDQSLERISSTISPSPTSHPLLFTADPTPFSPYRDLTVGADQAPVTLG